MVLLLVGYLLNFDLESYKSWVSLVQCLIHKCIILFLLFNSLPFDLHCWRSHKNYIVPYNNICNPMHVTHKFCKSIKEKLFSYLLISSHLSFKHPRGFIFLKSSKEGTCGVSQIEPSCILAMATQNAHSHARAVWGKLLNNMYVLKIHMLTRHMYNEVCTLCCLQEDAQLLNVFEKVLRKSSH